MHHFSCSGKRLLVNQVVSFLVLYPVLFLYQQSWVKQQGYWGHVWTILFSKLYFLIFALCFDDYNCKKKSTFLILKISTNLVSAMIESLYLQGSPIMVSILRPVTNGLHYRMRTMIPWGLGWLRCFVASTLLQRVTPPSTTFPARISLKAQVCMEFHSFGEANNAIQLW